MEKDILIQNLKTKAGVDNLSERTYEEVATVLLPMFEDDTKITDESWVLPVQMLKSASGQLRHEVANGITNGKAQWETAMKSAFEEEKAKAVEAAKAEWEKEKNKTQTAPPAPKEKDIDVAELVANEVKKYMGEESEFAKLQKQFGEFLTVQAEKEKAAKEDDIRTQVRNYLISRGVDEDDYALEITMEKLIIGEKPDVSVLSQKAEKDYEAIYKRMHKNDGAAPFNGGMGEGNKGNGAAQWLKGRDEKTQEQAKAAEERKKLLK